MPNHLKDDPTHTALLRHSFENDVKRRSNKLKRRVREAIVTKDVFGLRLGTGPSIMKGGLQLNTQYAFQTDPEKVDGFRKWFQQQIDEGYLETPEGTDPKKPWTAKYVESAYRKGIVAGWIGDKIGKGKAKKGKKGRGPVKEMNQAEFLEKSMAGPVAVRQLEALGTRSFEHMRGMTQKMSEGLSAELMEGFANGYGASKIAKNIENNIDGLTRRRGLVIARTEIIHAHAEGQLDSFEQQGVSEVTAEVEFSTAEDGKVCPRCAAMQGVKMTIAKARGVIPVHPSCRCAWLAVIAGLKEAEAMADAMGDGIYDTDAAMQWTPDQINEIDDRLEVAEGALDDVRALIKALTSDLMRILKPALRTYGDVVNHCARCGVSIGKDGQIVMNVKKETHHHTNGELCDVCKKKLELQNALKQKAELEAEIVTAKKKKKLTEEDLSAMITVALKDGTLSAQEIADTLGLKNVNTVRLHLKKMAEQGLVKKDGKKWVVIGKVSVKASTETAVEVPKKVSLKPPKKSSADKIAEAVGPEPKTALEIATASGVNLNKVRLHLKWMQKRGLVKKDGKKWVSVGDPEAAQKDTATVFVDKDGNPLIFYHGTGKQFDKFDNAMLHTGADKGGTSWYGHGVYLTGEPWKASSYAWAASGPTPDNGFVAKVTVKAKKPFVVKGTSASAWGAALNSEGLGGGLDQASITAALKKKGYDSILVMKDDGEAINELVVFEATDVNLHEWKHLPSFDVAAEKTATLTESQVQSMAPVEIPKTPLKPEQTFFSVEDLDNADFSSVWKKPKGGLSQSYGVVLFDDEGRVLLREPTNHFGGVHWTFAKGGGKSPASTALKELGEETGHTADIYDFLPDDYPSGYSKTNYFLGKSTGRDPDLMDDETSDIQWMSYEDARAAIMKGTDAAAVKRDLAVLDAAYKQHNAGDNSQLADIVGVKPKTWYEAMKTAIVTEEVGPVSVSPAIALPVEPENDATAGVDDPLAAFAANDEVVAQILVAQKAKADALKLMEASAKHIAEVGDDVDNIEETMQQTKAAYEKWKTEEASIDDLESLHGSPTYTKEQLLVLITAAEDDVVNTRTAMEWADAAYEFGYNGDKHEFNRFTKEAAAEMHAHAVAKLKHLTTTEMEWTLKAADAMETAEALELEKRKKVFDDDSTLVDEDLFLDEQDALYEADKKFMQASKDLASIEKQMGFADPGTAEYRLLSEQWTTANFQLDEATAALQEAKRELEAKKSAYAAKKAGGTGTPPPDEVEQAMPFKPTPKPMSLKEAQEANAKAYAKWAQAGYPETIDGKAELIAAGLQLEEARKAEKAEKATKAEKAVKELEKAAALAEAKYEQTVNDSDGSPDDRAVVAKAKQKWMDAQTAYDDANTAYKKAAFKDQVETPPQVEIPELTEAKKKLVELTTKKDQAFKRKEAAQRTGKHAYDWNTYDDEYFVAYTAWQKQEKLVAAIEKEGKVPFNAQVEMAMEQYGFTEEDMSITAKPGDPFLHKQAIEEYAKSAGIDDWNASGGDFSEILQKTEQYTDSGSTPNIVAQMKALNEVIAEKKAKAQQPEEPELLVEEKILIKRQKKFEKAKAEAAKTKQTARESKQAWEEALKKQRAAQKEWQAAKAKFKEAQEIGDADFIKEAQAMKDRTGAAYEQAQVEANALWTVKMDAWEKAEKAEKWTEWDEKKVEKAQKAVEAAKAQQTLDLINSVPELKAIHKEVEEAKMLAEGLWSRQQELTHAYEAMEQGSEEQAEAYASLKKVEDQGYAATQAYKKVKLQEEEAVEAEKAKKKAGISQGVGSTRTPSYQPSAADSALTPGVKVTPKPVTKIEKAQFDVDEALAQAAAVNAEAIALGKTNATPEQKAAMQEKVKEAWRKVGLAKKALRDGGGTMEGTPLPAPSTMTPEELDAAGKKIMGASTVVEAKKAVDDAKEEVSAAWKAYESGNPDDPDEAYQKYMRAKKKAEEAEQAYLDAVVKKAQEQVPSPVEPDPPLKVAWKEAQKALEETEADFAKAKEEYEVSVGAKKTKAKKALIPKFDQLWRAKQGAKAAKTEWLKSILPPLTDAQKNEINTAKKKAKTKKESLKLIPDPVYGMDNPHLSDWQISQLGVHVESAAKAIEQAGVDAADAGLPALPAQMAALEEYLIKQEAHVAKIAARAAAEAAAEAAEKAAKAHAIAEAKKKTAADEVGALSLSGKPEEVEAAKKKYKSVSVEEVQASIAAEEAKQKKQKEEQRQKEAKELEEAQAALAAVQAKIAAARAKYKAEIEKAKQVTMTAYDANAKASKEYLQANTEEAQALAAYNAAVSKSIAEGVPQSKELGQQKEKWLEALKKKEAAQKAWEEAAGKHQQAFEAEEKLKAKAKAKQEKQTVPLEKEKAKAEAVHAAALAKKKNITTEADKEASAEEQKKKKAETAAKLKSGQMMFCADGDNALLDVPIEFEVTDSSLGGSTGAKKVKVSGVGDYVMKTYSNGGKDTQAENEYLSNNIYRAVIEEGAPQSRLAVVHDKGRKETAVLGRYVEGAKPIGKLKGEELEKAKKKAQRGFVLDAWLGNWDSVGMTGDNMLYTADGRIVRIDNGGSLLYRAQGGLKGDAFGPEVNELSDLRNAKKNPSASKIFAGVTDQHIIDQVGELEYRIAKAGSMRKFLEGAGLNNIADPEKRRQIATTLQQRFSYLQKERDKRVAANKAMRLEKMRAQRPAVIPLTAEARVLYTQRPKDNTQAIGDVAQLNLAVIKTKSSLLVKERNRIEAFTGNASTSINQRQLRAARTGEGSDEYTKEIDDGLAKLPGFSGIAIRGESNSPMGLFDKCKSGDYGYVHWTCAASSSVHPGSEFGSTNGICYIIRTKGKRNGYVEELSAHSHEKEALFMSDTVFRVVGYAEAQVRTDGTGHHRRFIIMDEMADGELPPAKGNPVKVDANELWACVKNDAKRAGSTSKGEASGMGVDGLLAKAEEGRGLGPGLITR